jgi:hypothetical protein
MKNAFHKLIATATILLSFLSVTSAQSKAPTLPQGAASSPVVDSRVFKSPNVSEAAKTLINAKVSVGETKMEIKEPKTHTQSPGFSKFSMPVDKTSKVNVQQIAQKAMQ